MDNRGRGRGGENGTYYFCLIIYYAIVVDNRGRGRGGRWGQIKSRALLERK